MEAEEPEKKKWVEWSGCLPWDRSRAKYISRVQERRPMYKVAVNS